MKYQYIVLEVAQEDYKDSLLWYSDRSYLAAENFVKAIDDAMQLFCENPSR